MEVARWLAQTGDLAGGLRQQERALDALRKAPSLFGPNPNIVVARYEIADLQGQAGDVAGALSAIEQLLPEALAQFGPDHPNTMRMRDSLAGWRAAVGDLAGSVKALEDVVAESQRVFGPDHFETLTSRQRLASYRLVAGDAARALTEFEQLLPGMTELLGPADRWTLATRSGQADALGENGDPRGAVAALEQLVHDQARYLGPDHPDTLSTRMLLAYFLGRAGDPAAARFAYADVVADQVRVLGPDHPVTLSSRRGLARSTGESGDPVGARAALTALSADHLRVQGPDDPQTLRTREELARWTGEAGNPTAAAAALAALLHDQLRVLGPGHPRTAEIRKDLARWQAAAESSSPTTPPARPERKQPLTWGACTRAGHDRAMASAAALPRCSPVHADDALRALIRFRLLGQVEAWRGGERVELGGRKQRAVLASLLLRAGRVVSLDRLIDDLWPEDPPARLRPRSRSSSPTSAGCWSRTGPAALREPFWSRRRGATCWPSEPGSRRRARVRPAGRAGTGRARRRRPRAGRRAAAPRGELWRGPALADLTDAPFARAEAARLEELRLGADRRPHRRRARAGPPQRAGGRAGAAGPRHPMRERLRAQLMLALYRCGRQADALESYRAGRQVLTTSWGWSRAPGWELEQAVLRHDPDLDWEPPAPVMLPSPVDEPPGDEPGGCWWSTTAASTAGCWSPH